MPYHFRNLVFEGGGVKGIAYVGAMEVLGRRRILPDIVRVGGTSAGAINATLFALGYTNPQTRKLLQELDFNNFLDADWGLVRDSQRLLKKYGWYKGDYFRDWMGERIAHKFGDADMTFADLHAAGRPDLYVYGTNLSTGFGEVFSVEHTPQLSVATAVRISMSIPLFFAAVRAGHLAVDGAAQRSNSVAHTSADGTVADDIYVDGGLLDNYPVKLFDRLHYIAAAERESAARRTNYYGQENRRLAHRTKGRDYSPYVYNRQTLGLRLDSPQQITAFRDGVLPAHRDIKDLFDYARALISTIIEAQATQHLHSDDWQRTVYIDTLDVATADFDISDARKRALVDSGRACTAEYFEWFNDRNEEPVNRVQAAN